MWQTDQTRTEPLPQHFHSSFKVQTAQNILFGLSHHTNLSMLGLTSKTQALYLTDSWISRFKNNEYTEIRLNTLSWIDLQNIQSVVEFLNVRTCAF